MYKNWYNFWTTLMWVSVCIYVISLFAPFYFALSEFFSDGFGLLTPGAFTCYTSAQLQLSDITIVTTPVSDLSEFAGNELTRSKIRQFDILATCSLCMAVISCGVIVITSLTPPAAAGVFIYPVIAGASAASSATICGKISATTFEAFSKVVEAPEIVSSALEAAQGAVISTGTGNPTSTIIISSAAMVVTQILIWIGWPTHTAAVFGSVSSVVLHQASTLLFVSSVRDLVLSTPAMMSGVIFTPLVGGVMANYFTIGGNLMLQGLVVQDMNLGQDVYLATVEVWTPLERGLVMLYGWVFGGGACISIYWASHSMIKTLGLI